MPDPIPIQLARLRARYARHLRRLEASDMDPLFRRVNMKQMREAVEELDQQIEKEEVVGERLHDDIGAFKAQREREE